jgi:hypothetical protein
MFFVSEPLEAANAEPESKFPNASPPLVMPGRGTPPAGRAEAVLADVDDEDVVVREIPGLGDLPPAEARAAKASWLEVRVEVFPMEGDEPSVRGGAGLLADEFQRSSKALDMLVHFGQVRYDSISCV